MIFIGFDISGIGKEAFPRGGALMEEKMKNLDGDEEASQIPGCTYRSNQKEGFGKQKSNIKSRSKEPMEEKKGNCSSFYLIIFFFLKDFINKIFL